MKEPLFFCVFGLQRCCTNLTVNLVKRNFAGVCLPCGWKHGAISVPTEFSDRQINFIICVKNPYAWLVSCYRYFKDMTRHDWTVDLGFTRETAFCEFIQRPSYQFQNPIQRWNVMNRSWLEFVSKGRGLSIPVERYQLDQVDVLHRMSVAFNVELVKNPPVKVDYRVDNQGQITDRKLDSSWYQDHRYLSYYDTELLDFVSNEIDHSLLVDCGYRTVDTAAALSGGPVQLTGTNARKYRGSREILLDSTFLYRRIGYDERRMKLLPNGCIGDGAARCERSWKLSIGDNPVLAISGDEGVMCILNLDEDGVWRGQWKRFEQMLIELTPIDRE